MSEWWTYTLQDLLLFSPRTYYRLFAIYNAAIWPAQPVAGLLGLAILALRRRPGAAAGRIVGAILAAFWLWVAIAFHAARYATINTAGPYFAWAFGIEAALLAAAGLVRGGFAVARDAGLVVARDADLAGRVGIGIFAFALILEPLAAPLFGRGWRSAEIFGVAPDPTAIGTLGLLLASPVRHRRILMAIPALWCAITGAFLLAMKAPDFWIPPLAAVVALFATTVSARAQRRRSGASA